VGGTANWTMRNSLPVLLMALEDDPNDDWIPEKLQKTINKNKAAAGSVLPFILFSHLLTSCLQESSMTEIIQKRSRSHWKSCCMGCMEAETASSGLAACNDGYRVNCKYIGSRSYAAESCRALPPSQ
jgi:hypothetical protein